MIKYFVKIVLFMAIGLVITLFLHELSHLCVLVLLDGQLADFSIGTQSFVSGYIDQTHIPTVALGSIVIPSIIAIAILCIKSVFAASISASISVHSIINIVGGLICVAFYQNDISWDLVLAYKYANHWIIIAIAIIFLLINFCGLVLSLKKITDCA